MSMKAQHLNAMYARRRELEHRRIERTEALNRYYDHWGKVTTRYANWTTPEYYKQAEEQLQQTKDKKEKQTLLKKRQEELSELLTTEKKKYDQELCMQGRPKSRRLNASNATLEKIDDNLKKTDNIRRKLELEGKLYGKWRHGVDDDSLLYQSKSDHEVLAKLNWLDKQVEKQMQRDKEETESQERILRMQEELNKTEQLQKERQQIREKEIREVRAIQENYMEQLQERQGETETLKKEEKKLRENIEELDKEQELLDQSAYLMQQTADLTQAYNLKKIKMLIRKRSESFRQQIDLHISILERMQDYATKRSVVDDLIKKYKEKLVTEAETLSQIEAMYESEAKYSLYKYEESWNIQNRERITEMKDLLKGERQTIKCQLNDCLRRQEELLEVRSTCLSAIECASEKLKQLIKEEQQSPRNNEVKKIKDYTEEKSEKQRLPEIAAPSSASPSSLPEVTKSFTNLNLDVWQDLPSSKRGVDALPTTTRSLQVVTPETAERPKFGRKRIAWT